MTTQALKLFAIVLFVSVQMSSAAQYVSPDAKKQQSETVVPFVGCASDGQLGPQAAPTGKPKRVAISVAAARRLAYFKAEDGPGVLAPRAWNCLLTYGSSGDNLFVSLKPIDAKLLFSNGWQGFTGDVVQISEAYGGTSGRFQVAKVVARAFPAYKAFAQQVIAEGLVPASDFPSGPYSKDKLTYRGKSIVEFVTPANSKGLGTSSRLAVSGSPIEGVAIISGEDTDLTLLAARISGQDRDLIPEIVKQVETDASAAESR